MEALSVDNEPGKQAAAQKTRKKGGIITLPCIIANESFEKVSSYGLLPNMGFYLIKAYGKSITDATHIIFLWSAGTNFTPIVGAFIADSFIGRFLTVAFGSLFSLLGVIVTWITALSPKLRPPACDMYAPPCIQAKSSQFGVLIAGLALMSIGAGGIRSSSIAFGADQLNPGNKKVLETFFSWYYVSANVSVLLAVTVIVYIQDNIGWKVGFGIPVLLMFLSAFFFLVASPFYVKKPVGRSVFTELTQVAVAAFKNRKLTLPPPSSVRYHSTRKGTKYAVPSDKLRFLNKACVIKSPGDVTTEGVAANPWNLCTVEQVEDLKTLIRIIPLWSSGIMLQIAITQPYPGFQATAMNRHITSKFQLSPGSLIVFLVLSITFWISFYDRILIPVATKIRGKQVKISPKTRMGIGLFISCVGLAFAAMVERVRRHKVIKAGIQDKVPLGVVDMSVLWLLPQYILYGVADAFNTIGQIEFYYTEFPDSMSSIASSLSQLGLAVAYILASLILSLVGKFTGGGGKESWASNNINKSHLDYYYWLLCVVSALNLVYYFVCSWAYGPPTNRNLIDAAEDSADVQTHSNRINPSLDLN